VDLSRERPALLRPGGIPIERIEAVLGERLGAAGRGAPRVSGSLAAHYAPRRPLELLPADALEQRVVELHAHGLGVAVWSVHQPGAGQPADSPGMIRDVMSSPSLLWWPMPDDPFECGRVLFARLRDLDRSGADVLLIERPPDELLWAAVVDRLTRAAVGAGGAEGAFTAS
jgi:L-threonylcarbamoyladenylate synthase